MFMFMFMLVTHTGLSGRPRTVPLFSVRHTVRVLSLMEMSNILGIIEYISISQVFDKVIRLRLRLYYIILYYIIHYIN